MIEKNNLMDIKLSELEPCRKQMLVRVSSEEVKHQTDEVCLGRLILYEAKESGVRSKLWRVTEAHLGSNTENPVPLKSACVLLRGK